MMTNRLDAAGPGVHPPVADVDLLEGIQLAFADDRARRPVIGLEYAAAVDFGQSRPFRKLPAYHGQRNLHGWL
jgi:hypothetical protein